tara:strand:- start:923 stop:1246 length:324 start_codon:yes stop_codon:yes gene_type:complete
VPEQPERYLQQLLQRQNAVPYDVQLQFDAFRQGNLPPLELFHLELFPAPELPFPPFTPFTPSMHSDASCSTVESENIFASPWWNYYQGDELIPQWSHHNTPEVQVYY